MSTPANINFELKDRQKLRFHIAKEGNPKYMIPALHSLKICADEGHLITWSSLYEFIEENESCILLEFDNLLRSTVRGGFPFFGPDDDGSYKKRTDGEKNWGVYTYNFGYMGRSINVISGIDREDEINWSWSGERTEYIVRNTFPELFEKNHYWIGRL